MTSSFTGSRKMKRQGRFELLKVEGKLALRTPIGLGMGIALPVILLLVFGFIGIASPSNVGDTGLTIIDVYVPIVMVLGFVGLGVIALPYTMVRYREMGWLRRISTTPVPPSRLLAAQLALNLIVAVAVVFITIVGSEAIFGAPLKVEMPFFVLSTILSIAAMFSLGALVSALIPSQQAAQAMSGGLMFLLFFLAGLWVPPETVGGPLATIMYYSPSGAAVQALLYSVFNSTPPYMDIVSLVFYTLVFTFLAIRYFRWE